MIWPLYLQLGGMLVGGALMHWRARRADTWVRGIGTVIWVLPVAAEVLRLIGAYLYIRRRRRGL